MHEVCRESYLKEDFCLKLYQRRESVENQVETGLLTPSAPCPPCESFPQNCRTEENAEDTEKGAARFFPNVVAAENRDSRDWIGSRIREFGRELLHKSE